MDTRPLGFASKTDTNRQYEIDKENLFQYVNAVDLKSYGLIPELIGRLPVVTHLDPLDKKTLRKILTEPKNALTKQYKKLFDMEGIKLEFEPGALDYIVDKSLEYKLGARGLRSICEAIITEAMFNFPSDKNVKEFSISKEYAIEKFEKSKFKKLKVA